MVKALSVTVDDEVHDEIENRCGGAGKRSRYVNRLLTLALEREKERGS